MNPFYGKLVLVAGLIATVLIRIPHDKISQKTHVAENRKGSLEKLLLGFMGIGTMLLPIVYITTPILTFADYSLSSTNLALGCICLILNIWLFKKSHSDLGNNWSVTLQIRENHRLVESGIYKKIRHPMYTSIFFYAIAQSLLLANWIAGPACLVAFTLMYSLRIRPEEQMMLEKFGEHYAAYMKRTKRLLPGVF